MEKYALSDARYSSGINKGQKYQSLLLIKFIGCFCNYIAHSSSVAPPRYKPKKECKNKLKNL